MLLAIPSYFISTVRLLVSFFWKIEKIAREFIWGSNVGIRKPSLLNWLYCCKSMDIRGLRIRNLANQNKVFLLKLGFDIVANSSILWVRVLRSKYNVQGILPQTIPRSGC